MWFSILKINLATLQESVRDTQATDIDIKTDNKCKEKLQNFAKKLESSGLHFDRKVNNIDEMDEELACIVVESLDKHFNTSPSHLPDIYGMRYNSYGITTRDEFNLKDMGYEIDIDSKFAPMMDFTRIVIFDIDVMSWAKNNRGTVRFMSYKISTMDKNMTFNKVSRNDSEIIQFERKATKEYKKIISLWRSS